jgi:hypothetical protein
VDIKMTGIKEKISLGIFITSIAVLLILGFFVISEKGLTGKVVSEENNQAQVNNNVDEAKVSGSSGQEKAVSVVKYEYRGSGGGYGGESGGVSSNSVNAQGNVGQIYDLSELGLESMVEVVKYDYIIFTLSNLVYNIEIKDVSKMQATMNVNSGPQFNMGAGEERIMDLNNDGINDINIKLKSIDTITGRLNIILSKL